MLTVSKAIDALEEYGDNADEIFYDIADVIKHLEKENEELRNELDDYMYMYNEYRLYGKRFHEDY